MPLDSYWQCARCLRKVEEERARLVKLSSADLAKAIDAFEAASDPTDIARRVVTAHRDIPYKTIRAAWMKLVASGVLDLEPSSELITMDFRKAFLRETWREIGRHPAWRAGNTWIDAAGMPWRPSPNTIETRHPATFAGIPGEPLLMTKFRPQGGTPSKQWQAVGGVYLRESGSDAATVAVRSLVLDSPLAHPTG